MAYDAVILGVSIVQTYRSQFSGVLKKESLEKLIERLRSSAELGS
jgi:ABC-type transporter MlaC component